MITNLEYYKVFYYVAKLSGITAASKKLMVSQPAVSQSIHQLESELGCELFIRTSRGMKLSAEGELLFDYVSRGYEQIENGTKQLSQMLKLDSGEVRVGASDMTLRFYLLPYLEKFHEMYPGIKVTVTNGPTPETINYLDRDLIDFGIVSSPFDAGAGVTGIDVKPIADTFVAGRKFIQYKNHMMDFSDLEKLPIISLEKNTSTRHYIDSFLSESGVLLQPEFELATSDMIVQFAVRNLGIGCVMRDFAKEEIESGVLFELRFQKIIPKRNISIIINKKKHLSVAADKLLDLMLESHK